MDTICEFIDKWIPYVSARQMDTICEFIDKWIPYVSSLTNGYHM